MFDDTSPKLMFFTQRAKTTCKPLSLRAVGSSLRLIDYISIHRHIIIDLWDFVLWIIHLSLLHLRHIFFDSRLSQELQHQLRSVGRLLHHFTQRRTSNTSTWKSFCAHAEFFFSHFHIIFQIAEDILSISKLSSCIQWVRHDNSAPYWALSSKHCRTCHAWSAKRSNNWNLRTAGHKSLPVTAYWLIHNYNSLTYKLLKNKEMDNDIQIHFECVTGIL